MRIICLALHGDQLTQTVKIGDTGLAFFKVTNLSDRPITGRAVFNVVPEKAGAYFSKLERFWLPG